MPHTSKYHYELQRMLIGKRSHYENSSASFPGEMEKPSKLTNSRVLSVHDGYTDLSQRKDEPFCRQSRRHGVLEHPEIYSGTSERGVSQQRARGKFPIDIYEQRWRFLVWSLIKG